MFDGRGSGPHMAIRSWSHSYVGFGEEGGGNDAVAEYAHVNVDHRYLLVRIIPRMTIEIHVITLTTAVRRMALHSFLANAIGISDV